VLNRQAFAALRAAAFQYCSAVFGRHPRPKTVLFRTTAVVGLVRSLWHNCSPLTSPESENLKFTENVGFCQRNRSENG
jgi:hypothetical protein